MPTKYYVKKRGGRKTKKFMTKADRKIYRIAKVAAKSQAKQQINMQFEKHYHDHSDENSITWAGVVQDISQITVGDTDTTRSGDRVTLKSVTVRGTVVNGDAGGNLMRVMLVQCLRADSAASPLTAGEIVQAISVATRFSPYSSYSKDHAGYTWVPLADVTLSMSDTGNQQQQFEFKIKPKDFRGKAKPYIQFESGTVYGVGKLYLIYFSDSGAVNHPTEAHWSRIRFIDN